MRKKIKFAKNILSFEEYMASTKLNHSYPIGDYYLNIGESDTIYNITHHIISISRDKSFTFKDSIVFYDYMFDRDAEKDDVSKFHKWYNESIEKARIEFKDYILNTYFER